VSVVVASMAAMTTTTTRPPVRRTSPEISGPDDLAEVALMGLGHRDEQTFDGVMRPACCLDGGFETPVGVEARQQGDRVELAVHAPPGSSSRSRGDRSGPGWW